MKKPNGLGNILAGVRAFLLVLTLLVCLSLFLPTEPLARNKNRYARNWRRFYCKIALWILGCTVTRNYTSKKLPAHYLLVSNHQSFSDPLVALAYLDGMPVAKAEIRKYPIIGYAALKTGIIYVQRDEKSSRKNARNAVAQALKEGRSVLVYPEGTISPSRKHLHPFRSGVFYAATQQNTPIISVALLYHKDRSYWKSDRGLLKQFFIQFGTWKQKVTLSVSDPLLAEEGKSAAIKSQSWIQEQLSNMS